MAKGNGKERQDAILSQFARDAKSNSSNTTINECLKAGKKASEWQEARRKESEGKPQFIPSAREFYN